MSDLDKCNKIIDELIDRLPNEGISWGIIEWSLWSAVLTLFFKQFSNNQGRKLKLDYKEIFKITMIHDDYKAYKGVRDGYIAHANNKQNQFLPVALVDKSRKVVLGSGVLGLVSTAAENKVDIKTFKDMINIVGLWTENKKIQISNVLLQQLKASGYEEIIKWPIATITIPESNDMRTNSRETQ